MDEEIRVSIGSRLREERERLGLSQLAFAELGDASSRTAQDWEKGVSAPKGDFLARAAAAGVDVLYVLTGKRSSPFESSMSDEEVALVENYRRANPSRQVSLRDVITALAKSDPTFSNPAGPRVVIRGDVGQSVLGDQVINGAVHIGTVKKRDKS